MREKTSEKEYHYICEPNIPTIKLTKEFINNAIKSMRFDCDKIEKDLYQNNVDHKIRPNRHYAKNFKGRKN